MFSKATVHAHGPLLGSPGIDAQVNDSPSPCRLWCNRIWMKVCRCSMLLLINACASQNFPSGLREDVQKDRIVTPHYCQSLTIRHNAYLVHRVSSDLLCRFHCLAYHLKPWRMGTPRPAFLRLAWTLCRMTSVGYVKESFHA